MNVMHSGSSVIHIETNDGISINMFVETAGILYKKLGLVLTAIGHLERVQNSTEEQPSLKDIEMRVFLRRVVGCLDTGMEIVPASPLHDTACKLLKKWR